MARRGRHKIMPALIFDSRPLVARMTEELHNEAAQFRKQYRRSPRLAQIIAGHHGSAEVYSRQLVQACREIGLGCATLAYPFEISEEEVRAEVATLNNDPHTDGVVLLLPLPEHIRQRVVTDGLAPEKDVDGLGSRNAGNLSLGFPSFIPSTADAVLAVLREARLPVAGRHAVVVGRSNIGGKPIALVLLRQDATVTICHSYTQDLASITRSADILVVSTGRPHSINAAMVKPGAIVLDAGMNSLNGKVVGDVDFASVREVASFLTPVPGGLGPLTRLMLIRHTLIGPQ
jgi:methylenetetrahydrofolate dehydrogenase (NADP+) / methenyltetrahydrofolate cyclohydrolase